MIIDKLNEVLNSVDSHTTMYVFCEYIKTHIHDVAQMTIDEIAKNCYSSKGQISKCAKNLGFSSYAEFKDACVDYSQSIRDKPRFFSKEKDLPQNTNSFATEISQTILHVTHHINYSHLNRLMNDILESQTVYLYAQGDNRSLCNVIQVELSLYKPIVICDADFIKEYQFQEGCLLLILSTNGTIFHLNKRIIARIMKANVKTWLVTCNHEMTFNKNILIVPSLNIEYNKFGIRYVIDVMIAYIQFVSRLKQ